MSVADKTDDHFVPEVDPNPAEPRMVIWSTLRCLELQIDQHEERYNSDGVVSWELLKHMLRLAKRHAHEEGGKAIAAERETDQWRMRADEANAKLREAEQELQRLRKVHMEFKSEELTEARATIADLEKQLDAARAEIDTLRKELADAQRAASHEFVERQVLTVEQQQDAAAWQQQVDSANAEVSYLRARLEEERSVSAGLREKLAEAQQPGVGAMRAFVGKVRACVRACYEWPQSWHKIEAALAELDAEPTPVAEPLDGEGGQ